MSADTWTPDQFKTLLDDFGGRLADDAAFAARAQADAPAALREVAGRDLPDGMERFTLTATPDGLALGAPEAAAGGELNEDDLETVVGGVSGGQAAAMVLMGAVAGAYLAGSGEAQWSRSTTSSIGKAVLFGAIAGAGAGAAGAIQATIAGH